MGTGCLCIGTKGEAMALQCLTSVMEAGKCGSLQNDSGSLGSVQSYL